jgi:hypothetical protein
MINEVTINRLDELIGDFDTPFFNYLLYSYDLSLDDCEEIVDDLKNDITENRVTADNIVSTLEDYFKSKVVELEVKSKVNYLTELINPDNDFFKRFLERYGLSEREIDIVYERVESRILADNISDFEIKRFLEYYFANAVKQKSYLNDLDRIIGRNYDTLIIKKAEKNYPILLKRDIRSVISDIRSDILDAYDFKKPIKDVFLNRCMRKSEKKKADALSKLQYFVEGSGDSFSKLVRFKGLEKRDGEIIVNEIQEDIARGLVQPDGVNSVFLTKRFNEYNERK